MNKKTVILLFGICAAVIIILLILLIGGSKKQAAAVSPSPAEVSASASPETSPSAEAAAQPAEMSSDKLQSFETMLNGDDCYGFLLSQYSDVRSADLTQIFYNGAGITPDADAGSIVKAYQAALGDDAPETDCTVLKTKQIDAFLKEKTGYTLSQMQSKLDWEYDSAHDAYLFFHGDTNKVSVKLASGKALGGDKYQLTCTFDGAFYDANAGEVNGCVVTFTYKNGKPVFLSNTFVS